MVAGKKFFPAKKDVKKLRAIFYYQANVKKIQTYLKTAKLLRNGLHMTYYLWPKNVARAMIDPLGDSYITIYL